jgi:hypothetical protein
MEEGVEGDRAVVDRVRREVLRRQAPSDPIVAAWLDDDANVARFLRAEGGVEHAHKAVKRLVSMLAWMKEERPHELVCPACFKLSGGVLEASAAGHYMHVVTYDLMDRPTIYSCLELAANKDIDDNRKHLISTFETAIGLMPPGVEQWNWVLDMHGFRLVDCDPRLAKIFLSLAGERYPERLGNFWVVDAPGIFSTLWACVERFIDPVTKEKIKFVKTTDAKNGEQVGVDSTRPDPTRPWTRRRRWRRRIPGTGRRRQTLTRAPPRLQPGQASRGASQPLQRTRRRILCAGDC